MPKSLRGYRLHPHWIPAYAGMTAWGIHDDWGVHRRRVHSAHYPHRRHTVQPRHSGAGRNPGARSDSHKRYRCTRYTNTLHNAKIPARLPAAPALDSGLRRNDGVGYSRRLGRPSAAHSLDPLHPPQTTYGSAPVIPAQAGIQERVPTRTTAIVAPASPIPCTMPKSMRGCRLHPHWIPAYAGMTAWGKYADDRYQ